MADFCQQASMELFDDDFGDLRGLCREGYFVDVLCEDCGFSMVDYEGVCQGGEYCKHGRDL